MRTKASDTAYPTDDNCVTAGLTIRQRYIMAAMQGLCANTTMTEAFGGNLIADAAIIVADATLRAAGVETDE